AAAALYAGADCRRGDRHGMPGFRGVLAHVAEAYRARPSEVAAAAREVTEAIGASLEAKGEVTIDHAALDRAAARIAQAYDPANGGFGGAPKFPPSMTLDFLMPGPPGGAQPASPRDPSTS